ncbi:MAG: hypothetical protein O3B87_00660 [bacterium]|nr:hypothetical protein [bacterium]
MKKGPIILIALLIVIIVFIGGMQYGKRVETADKAIAMILKITPPPYTITIIPEQYITITDEDCKISYLLPDYAQDQKNVVTVMCGAEIASDSASVKDDEYSQLIVSNPKDKTKVLMRVKNELLPLIERTFMFSK